MNLALPYLENFKARPKVFYQNVLLCDSDLEQNLTILESEVPQILAEIYPNKTFIQLLTWINFFNFNNLPINKQNLALTYSFYWTEYCDELLKQHPNWNSEFKSWCHEKKANPNDLRSLILLAKLSHQQIDLIFKFTKKFNDLNFSLSEGKQFLELTLDLILNSEIELLDLFEKINSNKLSKEKVIKKLHLLRYPLTSKSDDKKKNFIKNTIWPNQIKVKFQRQGDKSGFEGSFYINQIEQTKKLKGALEESLNNIEIFLKNNSETVDNNDTV